jgi:hypothetical protein
MRKITLLSVALVAALGMAGVGSAQSPPPTITVTASESSLTVGATSPVASGPTRFNVVNPSGDELEIAVGALREGVTVAEFTTTLRSNPDAALEMAHIDSGASLTPRDASRAVTFDLRPDATYVVANLAGENPANWEITSFTTSATANGATAPQADASVRIVDLRFRGSSRLPRNGVVRFENGGWAPHFAFAIPLKRKARKAAVGRALRRNQERRLGRLVDFANAVEPQSLITRGAVNYNEVRFPRRGRYVMTCFFEGHNTQGMFRFIRVR